MDLNIKKFAIIFLVNVLTVGVSMAQDAPMWMLDKAHTSVNFSINHFFSEVNGKFKNFDGTFKIDPKNVKDSKFAFTITVASVETDNEKRNNHLQSEDFFDVAHFPTIKFESTKVVQKANNEYVAEGKLTIRDVTKKVKLPFKVTGQMEHPMMKGTNILGLSINTTINRNDFGVGSGDWAATMVVGDEVRINIPIELNSHSDKS